MSNPFGAEPPVKPAKTAKPAPANPFGASNPRPVSFVCLVIPDRSNCCSRLEVLALVLQNHRKETLLIPLNPPLHQIIHQQYQLLP